MICKMTDQQIESVLQIWLEASLISHHFIDESYWHNQLASMRDIYLPSSINYVYLDPQGQVQGFIALLDKTIAALFILPTSQGKGIGKQLLEKAKSLNKILQLSVYKENKNAVDFYTSQGFKIKQERLDPHTQHSEFEMCWRGS